MNIGDDVTINGKIIHIKHAKGLNKELIYVRVKSGIEFPVTDRDINTIRPKIEIPDTDARRGR